VASTPRPPPPHAAFGGAWRPELAGVSGDGGAEDAHCDFGGGAMTNCLNGVARWGTTDMYMSGGDVTACGRCQRVEVDAWRVERGWQ
jgi:hypothetical protein